MSTEAGDLIARAERLAVTGDFGPVAEQINRQILGLVPNEIRSMTRLAKCLRLREAKVEAEALYRNVLEIDAENLVARNALSELGGRKPDPARTRAPNRGRVPPGKQGSISALFDYLDAPLKNIRWSWGAERARDGVVFLRVWDNELRSENGSTMVEVLGREGGNRPGYRERQQQLGNVRAGRNCYLIFCHTDDPKASPWTINTFEARNVYRVGRLTERGGEVWAEVLDRVPVERVRQVT
ncbi:MAG: tetratricopeptide repeat protein [Candidatus Dormibacteria bacterium]